MLKWRWLELVLGEKYERGEKMAIENWHLYYGKWIWGKNIRISFTFWDSSNCFLEGAKARINHLECPVLTVVMCTIQIVVTMSGDKRWEHFGVLWNVCQKVVMFLNIVFFWPFLFFFFIFVQHFYLLFYWSIIALQCCVRFSCTECESALCRHVSPSSGASLPPSIPRPQVITEHGAELPVRHSSFPPAIHFTHGRVYMSVGNSRDGNINIKPRPEKE